MRRPLALLCLSLGLVLAQPQRPALVGPALPAPYEVQHLYTDGNTQVITAVRRGGPEASLVLARDTATKRTLWKLHVAGALMPQEVGQGIVNLEVLTTGAILRSETLVLRLRSGELLKRGLFEVAGVRSGKALLVDYGDTPPSEAFLTDPARLTGEVIDTRTGRTLSRNFPIPTRGNCGQLKSPYQGSNHQLFEVNGPQLLVPREDDCGRFQAV